MYAPTSIPFVSRTRATLRSAEFGFLGVVVYTRVQTPRFCGAPRRAGVFTLAFGAVRPLRTSRFTVGIAVAASPGERGLRHNKGWPGACPCQPDKHGSESLSGASNPRNPHRCEDLGWSMWHLGWSYL